MKKFLFVPVLASLLGYASAQESEPYTPWEFNQGDANTVGNFLGELPAKYALPLIKFFSEKETVATKRKEMANKPAPSPAPTPTPNK